ncbi:7066_t:CDS:2 [Entrophospora sp. SA101]|nr:7066_t:CDS:2 [Entrophospora sp. SA101]
MKIYGGNPIEDEQSLVECKGCSKKILKQGFVEHTAASDAGGDVGEQNKRSLSPSSGTKLPEPKKQKTKKEQPKKKSTGRNKGPIDLDKQCGVLMPPSNSPCTRSLTCKSHSMHLKRSVNGRSAPYDQLLASYQKKSIGRPQTGGKQENAKKDGRTEIQEKEEDTVINSDEEVDAVLEAIMRSKPRPLVSRPDTYVSPNTNYY